MRIAETVKRKYSAFLAGPEWLELPDWLLSPLKKEYKSPTVILAAWIYALSGRILTRQGRMIAIAFAVITFYSSILSRSPAVMLFCGLAGLLIMNLIAGLIFRPKMKITREVPFRVTAGKTFAVRYRMTNMRNLPCIDVGIDISEWNRNIRRKEEEPDLINLAPRETTHLTHHYTALKRGVYRLGKPMAETAFPFNVIKFTCSSSVSQKLTAHPKYWRLNDIVMPGGSKLQRHNISMVSKVGESMDFHGCREFRAGDDPRKIHWLASAKHAELIVKEFQEERLTRAAIILDNYIPRPKFDPVRMAYNTLTLKPMFSSQNTDSLEAAVSLTASLAASLSANDLVVDIFAAGNEVHHFRTGRSLSPIEDFLDILSTVKHNEKEPFDKLSEPVLNEISSIGSVFMILLRHDRNAEKLYRTLVSNGAHVRAFHIASGKTHEAIPPWTIPLSSDEILSGRLVKL